MRLLNTRTLRLEEFFGKYPNYAILSHTWGRGEISYEDMKNRIGKNKEGYAKIIDCCKLALAEGYSYVWIDTCCIDKDSSADLSEAINSMFAWYKDSAVCYAYLEDYNPPKGDDKF